MRICSKDGRQSRDAVPDLDWFKGFFSPPPPPKKGQMHCFRFFVVCLSKLNVFVRWSWTRGQIQSEAKRYQT